MAAAARQSELPPSLGYARPLANYKWQFATPGLLEDGRRLGDVWTLRLLGGATLVFIADPKLVGEVFNADPSVMHHELLLTPVVGMHSLLALDEPAHGEARRLLQPPFHGRRVDGYREAIQRVCDEDLAGWPIGEPFALLPRLQTIALHAIVRVIFGVEGDDREQAVRTLFSNLLEWGSNPFHIVLMQQLTLRGKAPPKSLRKLLAPVDEIVAEEIDRARNEPPTDRDDVVAMLVTAKHDDGSPLSDREIRDHIVTLTFQGHRSTANAMAWAFERATRHREVLDRLAAEAETDSVDYVDAVVKETLRIRSPFPFVMRSLKKPFAVGEYELPAGTLIALNAHIIHRRPDLYPEPETFRPERFLGQQPAPFTYIPFGGGVRACIGAAFALLEMRVVMQTIFRRFRIAPSSEPGEKIKRLGVQFSPARGGRVVLLGRR